MYRSSGILRRPQLQPCCQAMASERRRLPLVVAAALLFSHAVAEDEAKQCQGNEEEFGDCVNTVPCDDCTPVDCKFGSWGSWAAHDFGGCSGLIYRMRTVGTLNNECGKPCSGPTGETREYKDPKCQLEAVDCELSSWSAWSACGSDTDQSYRTRQITTEAENNGVPCTGELKQTKECSAPPTPVSCAFSDWYEWTTCSVSCDAGRRQRMRKVTQTPKYGGAPCSGATLEVKNCQLKKCKSEDAYAFKWTEWSDCDGSSLQKTRSRSIAGFAIGSGDPFEGPVEEIGACPTPQTSDCEFAAWSDWSNCSHTCQKFRKRHLTSAPTNGGSCKAGIKIHETTSCNHTSCIPTPPQDCVLSDWTVWGKCDDECGPGSMNRTRSVVKRATKGGLACSGNLEEVKSCTGEGKNCGGVACQWFDWSNWGGCSCDCGGGSKSRHRAIKVAPKRGGRLCDPKDKKEIAPCNTQSCNKECVDGKWHLWSHWSVCSATCGTGYKSRSREIATEPNGCGHALAGVREDYQPCKAAEACGGDEDCDVSNWSEWSSCSCKCMGIRERSRYIKTFVAGNGQSCNDMALKETSSCNDDPHSPACGDIKVDCEWSGWEEGNCTRTCGGGQMEKRRRILKDAVGGGVPCTGDLLILESCNTEPCEHEVCTDCRWGSWGEWSDCTHCGGQRFRRRNIDHMANYCGKQCDSEAAQEMESCKSTCASGKFVCKWSDWSEAECPKRKCGDTSAVRTRSLGFDRLKGDADSFEAVLHESLFIGLTGAICTGSETSLQLCDLKDCECEPEDCVFTEWEEWSSPGCEGLCQRSRLVKRPNNECGAPCDGSLVETKKCPVTCGEPIDCVWGQWDEWTSCLTPYAQRTRSRKVKLFPNWRGRPCSGEATETTSCFTPPGRSNCVLSDWSTFGECSASCGGGLRSRHRYVVSEASNGGKLCTGSLEDMETCSTQGCVGHDVDCELSGWSAWSHCDPDNQKQRTRVVQTEAKNNGRRCSGDLIQVLSCNSKVIDCKMSEWTHWDECDRECDGGQKRRHRQIAVYPKNGGQSCPTGIVETAPCNAKPCVNADCKLAPWAKWGECSSDCDGGQQSRVRAIAQFRAGVGKGCSGKLEETRKCFVAACPHQDCEWADWQDWDTCTCSCDGGTTKRSRDIKKMPRHKGKACTVQDKEEVRPCNTGPCNKAQCVDGVWGDWNDWAGCTASCGGGTTYRQRHQIITANSCGKPADGPAHESGFCNVGLPCEPPIDCEFGAWTDWEGCTQTCDGITRRSRRIAKYGRGLGGFCQGPIKQLMECNKCEKTGEPVDCKLGKWEKWSECTRKCGGGQRHRSRKIQGLPSNGGKPCEADLEKVEECNREPCEDPDKIIDCALADWEDWGSCTQVDQSRHVKDREPCLNCHPELKTTTTDAPVVATTAIAAEMLRSRRIKTYPRNGGKQCKEEHLEEVKSCEWKPVQVYCTWAAWSNWGDCSSKCGAGRRVRKRSIVATTKKAPEPLHTDEIMKRFEALQLHTASLEQGRLPELAMAFAAGMLTLGVAFGAWRAFGFSRRQPLSDNRDMFMDGLPADE
eukprot:TRINITY_DN4788_c0_g1_i2.p1 TRINITY_DN4788_c0_g1~~TRINITY_DN4788_c0_g1_i2.p1  ORF type:complete len:1557 (-),score=362.68 TRINITY_DN4788_c0_g1_i2:90-4760(-)